MMAMPLSDLSGRPVGRLVILHRAGWTPTLGTTWLCRCACGREIVRAGKSLRRGQPKSCDSPDCRAAVRRGDTLPE